MDKSNFDKKQRSQLTEIKFSRPIIFILLIIVAMQTILIMWSFNYEKIIIVPTNSPENSYWIRNDMVSVDYLERYSRDIVNLGLNISPETVDNQFGNFLTLITPNLRPYLITSLQETAQEIKQNHVSQVFYIDAIKTIPATQTVYIRGFLKKFIDGNVVSNTQQIYKIKFNSNDLTVKVNEFELLDPNKDQNEIKKINI
jgi:type IV conjugative transfer system protein TraE